MDQTAQDTSAYMAFLEPVLYNMDYFNYDQQLLSSLDPTTYFPCAIEETGLLETGESVGRVNAQYWHDTNWFSYPAIPNIPVYYDDNSDKNNRCSRYSISSSSSPEAPPVDYNPYYAMPVPQTKDLLPFGVAIGPGTWRCAYPGCTSKTRFLRGCDLRKHFKRHKKHLFCRHNGCPKSLSGGFANQKDLSRHEAKHNPTVVCQWEGCSRLFSRKDNMRDHIRRVHQKVHLQDYKCTSKD